MELAVWGILNRKFIFAIQLLLLGNLLLTSCPAYPWGNKGHEIIGHIAQGYLTDHTRKQIEGILGPKFSLAEEGVWPDQEGRRIRDMNPFHFVNFPPNTTAYDQERDCPDRNCIVEAIPWYRGEMIAKDAPLNLRRIALRYVVHLVGDIHQPLHAAYREDLGGNKILVQYKGEQVNLHKLWDISLLEVEEKGASAERATRLQQSVTPEERHR